MIVLEGVLSGSENLKGSHCSQTHQHVFVFFLNEMAVTETITHEWHKPPCLTDKSCFIRKLIQ